MYFLKKSFIKCILIFSVVKPSLGLGQSTTPTPAPAAANEKIQRTKKQKTNDNLTTARWRTESPSIQMLSRYFLLLHVDNGTDRNLQDDLVRKVEDRIFSFASEKRVRLEDFFAQFDRLRCRHITPAQFQRALTLTGVSATQAEVNALIAKYADRDDGRVNYRSFCDVVLKVERDLEKRPTHEPHNAYFPIKRTETLNPALEKEFTFGLLPKLKKWVKERGLIPKVRMIFSFFLFLSHYISLLSSGLFQ